MLRLSFPSALGAVSALLFAFADLVAGPDRVVAAETICAVVKIEIRQELTLERQAFEAKMVITNGLDTMSLDDVDIDVLFADEAGNPVVASSDPNNSSAKFFIRLDDMTGVENVTGSGRIAPNAVAEVRWLIIPAPGAGGNTPTGKLYNVGATLSYTFGGEEQVVTVAPDIIRVRPMPMLTLDYFLPRDVFGDDPLTEPEEPIEAFDLGVRVLNSGAGPARSLKIESAQPKIVENRQGLLINFELVGSSVDDAPVQNTLLANFGDIAPDRAKMARWVMTSSLSGRFVSFEAEFVHKDELGGALTSLIEQVRTHNLLRSVRNDLPGRDTVRDFLAVDGATLRLYESDGADTEVLDLSASASLQPLSPIEGRPRYKLTVNAAQGPVFVRVADPHGAVEGGYEVWRSDGKRIDSTNAWRYRAVADGGAVTRSIGLFDTSSTGSYELRFGTVVDQNRAPQIAAVPAQTVEARQAIEVAISATDPDGDALTLLASGLPGGAQFEDLGSGNGRLRWTPSEAQVGQHTPVIAASDGQLSTQRSIAITVTAPPSSDSDNDGMQDAWEREHFGDLTHDGTADTDQDSATDLAEHDHGGDPNEVDRPGRVALLTPTPGTSVDATPVEFLIANATRAEEAALDYRFELRPWRAPLSAPSFADVSEQPLETGWTGPETLDEDQLYLWRAGATDGATAGDWSWAEFRFSRQDDVPASCGIAWPTSGQSVPDLRPSLVARIGPDPEGDEQRYLVEVFADEGLVERVSASPILRRLAPGDLSWRVYPALENGRSYWWRASTVGGDGQPVTRCPVGRFTLDVQQALPQGYTLQSDAEQGVVRDTEAAFVLSGIGAAPAVDTVQFELSDDGSFESGAVQRGSVSPTGGSAHWTATGLQHGVRYYARARAVSGNGSGQWAAAQFSVMLPQAGVFVLAPRDGTWVDSRLPLLQVRSPGLGAEDGRFRFQLAQDATFAAPLVDALSGPRFTPASALQDRRWYWWRARAEVGSESGPWTEAMRFFVIDNAVEDAPQLSWLDPIADRTVRPGPVTLRWRAFDPDSNAQISLWLDGGEAADILIHDGLREDADAGYTWDMTGLPDGAYQVFARITDGTHTTSVHADGTLTLATPGLTGTAEDTRTSEAGDTAELTLRLAAAPREQVIVPVSVEPASEASVTPTVVVFNPDDWQSPRRVVVRGLNDDRVDVDQAFDVRWGGSISEDAAFAGLSGRVGMVNVDDDVAGLLLSAPDGTLATSEQGDTASLELSLATRPAAAVTVRLAVSDESEAIVSPTTITFDENDWNQPVALVVTGVDDAAVDGDVAYHVGVVEIESNDAVYRAASRPQVPGLNLDDERPEILLSPADGLVVSESGNTVAIRVRTNVRPDAPIRLAVVSSDLTEARVSAPELVLDASNWEVGLQVDVTGVGDQQLDGDQPFTITVGPAQSDDPRFANYAAFEVPGINQDRRDTGFQAGRGFRGTWMPGESKRVVLADVFTDTPVVFAQWISSDSRPYAVRLTSVAAGHFDAVLVRPAGMESIASEGELMFLAAQTGVHHLPDGRRIVVDAFEQLPQAAAPVWQAREFALPFTASPVVLTQIQTFANRQESVPRPWLGLAVANVAGNGLQLGLEPAGVIEPTALQPERLAYLAIEDGAQGVVAGSEYEARRATISLRSASAGCTPLPLSHTRGAPPLLWLSQNSRSIDAGSWGRLCTAEPSFVEARLDRYQDLTGTETAETEAAGLLAFAAPVAFQLEGAPAGVLVEQRFGNRTFVGAAGAAFGVRLAQAPTHAVTVPVSVASAQRLSLSASSLTFTPDDWDRTRWVRATAIDAPASGLEPVAVTLGVPTSGDARYAALAAGQVQIEVGAASVAQRIVDNAEPGFAAVGDWRRTTAIAGFYGSDYATHVAMGASPDGIVVDNGGAGYRTIGTWTTSTQRAGYFGANYDVREPGESPDARFVDDTDATLTGSWSFSRAGGPTYYGSGYLVARGGDGSVRAEWRLGSAPAGEYQLFARWADHNKRATNAPYTIRHADGTTRLTANQRVNGGTWQRLGTFRLNADSSVTLANDANGEVVADAIRLLPVNAEPNSAIWEPTLPSAGRYEVFARWPAHAHHATNAPFAVRHANGSTVVTVNQEAGGGTWTSLGQFDFMAQGARVTLTDEANDAVVADAVRFVPTNARPNRADWSFRAVPLGSYRYAARWTAASDRATNAPFTLRSMDVTAVGALNQRIDHARWKPLGRALAAPEREAKIELTDRADGVVVADAVRALDEASFGPRGSRIVDEIESEVTGTWTFAAASGSYDQGHLTIAAGDESARVAWPLAPMQQGAHRVFVRWNASADRSTRVRYQIAHAAGQAEVERDQRQGSETWTLLGTYELDAQSRLTLLRATDGTVSADAVRIEPAHYPEPTP